MNLQKLKKKILDSSPRQLYYEAAAKVLRTKTKPAWSEFSPIVVLSTGRVGTETLDALFQQADNLFSHHEPTPTLYRLSKLAYETGGDPLAQKILRESFLTARQDLLNYSLQCGRGYAETSPQVTFLAPIIFDLFPKVRFIHLVRDPHAVIRSGMRRKWYDGHPNDETRITPRPETEEAKQWNSYSPFQKNLWLWTETNRWILRFFEGVPQNQKTFLRAEEMFAGDETVLASIFDFIRAPVPSRRVIRTILGKRLNAQESGFFPGPSEWSDDLKQMLERVAGDVARQLGYEVK